MIVKRGDIVGSDFGIGAIVAITKSWIIHLNERGEEICVYLPENMVYVPAEFSIIDVPEENTAELDKV